MASKRGRYLFACVVLVLIGCGLFIFMNVAAREDTKVVSDGCRYAPSAPPGATGESSVRAVKIDVDVLFSPLQGVESKIRFWAFSKHWSSGVRYLTAPGRVSVELSSDATGPVCLVAWAEGYLPDVVWTTPDATCNVLALQRLCSVVVIAAAVEAAVASPLPTQISVTTSSDANCATKYILMQYLLRRVEAEHRDQDALSYSFLERMALGPALWNFGTSATMLGERTNAGQRAEGQQFSVVATGAGWVGETQQVRSTYPLTEVRIELHPATTLEIHVTNTDRLTPVSVLLKPLKAPQARGPITGHTDAKGYWVNGEISPGRWQLRISCKVGTAEREIEVRAGANSLSIQLDPANPVTGVIVDDIGLPVPKLSLTACDDAGSFSLLVETDEQGAFGFGVPAAVSSVRLQPFAMSNGLAPENYFSTESLNALLTSRIPAPSSNLRLVLVRKPQAALPAELTLDIVADETVLSKSEIQLVGDRWTPSQLFDGAFSLGSPFEVRLRAGNLRATLPPGKYRLRAIVKSANAFLVSECFDIDTAIYDGRSVRIIPRSGIAVTVQVVDENRSPVSGVMVMADGILSCHVVTDPRGVALLGILPEGSVPITIGGGDWELREPTTITIAEKMVTPLLVVVQSSPQVVVELDPTLRPQLAKLVLSPVQLHGLKYRVPQSDEVGFRGVAPGSYHIQAWYQGEKHPRHGMLLQFKNWTDKFRLEYRADGFRLK